MKIISVRAMEIDVTPHPLTQPRETSRNQRYSMSRPVARYPGKETHAKWERAAVVVTGEDGTWGFGLTVQSGPVVRIINDHLAPALIGESCLATEKLWDMMVRMTAAYGGALSSHAISAIDCAIWDLKGKVLERPVYELLGGPQKEKIFCYATGYDNAWYVEQGFKATKIFTPYGLEDGLDGLHKNVELVAETREAVGDDVELMLDCWLAMDEEYTVRLAEAVRPYNLKWIEDYVMPDALEAYRAIRQRLPWQTLATGEHWYLPNIFATAAAQRLVNIFQPDVLWGGGITGIVKICHLAEAAGISVITHAGMNYPYGQHLAYALPAIVWGERSEGVSAPGVPLAEMTRLPGTPAIKDGYLVPSDAPGFGLEFTMDWLEERTL